MSLLKELMHNGLHGVMNDVNDATGASRELADVRAQANAELHQVARTHQLPGEAQNGVVNPEGSRKVEQTAHDLVKVLRHDPDFRHLRG